MFRGTHAPWRKVIYFLPLLVGALLLAACSPDAITFQGVVQSGGDEAELTGTLDVSPDGAETPEPAETTETPEMTESAEPTHAPATTGIPGEATGTPEPTAATGDEIEFTGVLTAKDGNAWTVSSLTVIVGAGTEIKGDPQVGDTMKVHGAPQADGSVLAREIEVEAEGDQGEIEIVGVLMAKNGNVWTVGSFAVAVGAGTEIEGDPQIGDRVKVQGTLEADGAIHARQIRKLLLPPATETPAPTHTPEDEPSHTPGATRAAEVEFRGVLTAVNGNVWTVNGFAVVVGAGSEIKGDPQVGDMVKVHGAPQADGSVLAREIEVEDEATATPVSGAEIEFRGTLTAINGSLWTINGAVVDVSRAEIKDNPQIGDTVKVHGTLQPDGSVRAREVEKDNGNSGPGGGDDDHSGSGGSGSGGGGDDDDDHSGPGGGDDDSGSGSHP
jgi:hypothetical protein